MFKKITNSYLGTLLLAVIIVVSVASFLSYVEQIFWHKANASETLMLEKKPKIRVGLYDTDDWIKVKVNYKYRIKEAKIQTLKNVKRNQITQIKYNKETGIYTVKQGNDVFTTNNYIRIVPRKKSRTITITNYENRPAWNKNLNDNEFKGKLEVQYAASTDKTWVINELGLENYVKGVAEAGNENDIDYLKSLYTAARTYAYYHYLYPTKHDDEPYLLDSTANDQVYRGWGFTKRAPNIKKAVNKTAGKVITYDSEIVVTPYFSQSDGRTRSWNEVWAGEQEYLVSVDDPGCEGDVLTGHGVGMSAKGARYFAEELGWKWTKILKYYYTDIKIKSLY